MIATNKLIANNALKIFNARPKIFRFADEEEVKTIDLMICENCPDEGITSYGTIGLFNCNIGLTYEEKPLCMELLAACASSIEDFANIVTTTAFEIMDGKSVYPGYIFDDVVSMYIGNSDMEHILLTYPFLWGDVHNSVFDDITVAYLMAVPISDNEKEYCMKNGLDALESVFEEKQIDIFDIFRPSAL